MPRHAHVSLLATFRPFQLRAAAAWLSRFLAPIEVVLRLDPGRGNLELDNVRGDDLRLLTDHLYEQGARSVFVRYQHEGQGASLDREAGRCEASRDRRPS